MQESRNSRERVINDATYYDWKVKYGGIMSTDTKRLRVWRMKALCVSTR